MSYHMLTTVGIRVEDAVLGEIAALLPLMQAASPYASLTRGDVLRACLEAGIRTLKASLSHSNSTVISSTQKQSGVPLPQGRAPRTHENPGPVPDPAREEPGTVTGRKKVSLEHLHGPRIREIAKQYPRLGITGSGKLSWPGFADILWKEYGIFNPETGKAFTHGVLKEVVTGRG